MIDPSRHAVLWLLVGFVLATAATRTVTRAIRHRADRAELYLKENASPGLVRNMVIAGTHIHHQVWGILTLMFTGLLFFTYLPERGPVLNTMAFMFGAGAALTLDEFAMWLHLEDVYWSEEGRSSISALIVAVAITTALVVGANPFDVVPTQKNDVPGVFVALGLGINALFVVITILKGKLPAGLIGIFIPGLALITTTRVAKPGSWWARRRYNPGGRLDRRSRRRFGPEYEARWNHIRDLIGGRPYPDAELRRRRDRARDRLRRHL